MISVYIFPILQEKVEAAAKFLKKIKTAGIDNIPSELTKAGGGAMVDALAVTFSKIWKSGE